MIDEQSPPVRGRARPTAVEVVAHLLYETVVRQRTSAHRSEADLLPITV